MPIIKINGRKWLAGMEWYSISDRKKASPAKVRDLANKDYKADWYCIRKGKSVVQAGFYKPEPGATKAPRRLYSLAAMLADSREQPWLGKFDLGNGLWWYVAVRDAHAILPDRDIVGDEATIEEARQRDSGFMDWSYIEGDLELLGKLIKEISEKPTVIRSVSEEKARPARLLKKAVIGTVVAVAGYSWLSHLQHEALMHKMELAKERAEAALRRTPPPSPLVGMPMPSVWLHACGRVLENLPLFKYGWALSALSCDQKQAHAVWLREDGATVAMRPAGIIASSGDRIDQAINLPILPAGSVNPASIQDEKVAMWAWAQAADIPMSLQDKDLTALPGGAATHAKNSVKIDIKAPMAPFELGKSLDAIPGLRLDRISTKNDPGAPWDIEGRLYGN